MYNPNVNPKYDNNDISENPKINYIYEIVIDKNKYNNLLNDIYINLNYINFNQT